MLAQVVVDDVGERGVAIGRQIDEFLGAVVPVTALVVEDAGAQ
jgi:hypothetical protein